VWQWRIGRLVAPLAKEDRAAVLLPLMTSRLGDTRKLTSALVRDFKLPTELTPAAAPDARGDEASPAENEP
jgi:hypothetical protein